MKYDVVVVGAGPAGSTAAKFLSEKGIKTLLLDKEKFPRDKPCAGAIPMRILNRFKYIEEKNLIESYTYGTYLYLPTLKDRIEIQMEKPIHAMVLRKYFDNGLVNHAIECGTTFLDGKNATNIKLSKEKTKVFLNDDTSIESQLIIGADGIWSTVAKKYGMGKNHRNFGICIFQEAPIDNKLIDSYFTERRYAHLHVGFSGLNGYGWVFPKKNHINIGIVELKIQKEKSIPKKNLKEIYRNYIKNLKDNKIIPSELKLNKISSAPLPSCHFEKTYSSRMLLCGDAGGLINIGGGGIEYAMTSGAIAANIATDALTEDNMTEKYLSKYESSWKSEFGKDIKLFSHFQKSFGEKAEQFIKLAYKDKYLTKIILQVLTGNLELQEYKGKIRRRILYLYLKNLFSKN